MTLALVCDKDIAALPETNLLTNKAIVAASGVYVQNEEGYEKPHGFGERRAFTGK